MWECQSWGVAGVGEKRDRVAVGEVSSSISCHYGLCSYSEMLLK